jgi:mannosyltransferase OCH1-like enzyme
MINLSNRKSKVKLNIDKTKFYNRPYIFFKPDYTPIIPLDIYQTWSTKDLPPKMSERVELLKSQNPRFKHHLFDDNDCREFIRTHFKPDVLWAYDSLIPGAYKADLWRLCVLFINGGIYLDIKFCCVNGFRLIELTEKEHFVKDRSPCSVYNALMACKRGNFFLFKCIRRIVQNVQNRFYGTTPLSPTGPKMLGSVVIDNTLPINVDLIHYEGGGYIVYKNIFIISTDYPEYNHERTTAYNNGNTQRYDKLWEMRNIYK